MEISINCVQVHRIEELKDEAHPYTKEEANDVIISQKGRVTMNNWINWVCATYNVAQLPE